VLVAPHLARSSTTGHQCLIITAQSVAGFAGGAARIVAIVPVYLKGHSQCLVERVDICLALLETVESILASDFLNVESQTIRTWPL
jgi:hypothetical protein